MAFEGYVLRAAVALSCLGLLAGCGGSSGFEAPRDDTSTLGSLGSKLGNLVAFNTLFPGSAPLPQTEASVACPIVEVQDGTASARFYRGASQANSDVRYGFSLGDVARECSKVGDRLQIKVGVEGRVLVGPAGQPGTFTVPIRVAVRNDNTRQPVTSLLVRVSATVPLGGTQAGFSTVTEPFSVPFVPHPDDDYTILVGFDSGRGAQADPAARPRRKQR